MRIAAPGSFPRVPAVFLSLLLALAGAARIQAVQLDPGFHGIIPQQTYATALTLQPGTRIVVLAPTPYPGQPGIYLVRLKPSGEIDTSFGTGGSTGFSGPPGTLLYGAAATTDSAGRILVAGSLQVQQVSSSFFAARFLPDGAIDPSFGAGGLAVIDFPGLSSGAGGLELQLDGRILLAGGTSDGLVGGHFAAVRLLMDGAVDGSFGSTGRSVIDLGTSLEGATSVVVLGDGRIVLGGRTEVGAAYALTLAGLTPDGVLDPTFGSGGQTVVHVAESSECRSLALAPGGRIVGAGSTTNPNGAVVVRALPGGTLDPAFGHDGVATADFMSAAAMAVDGSGRVLIAGESEYSFALARFLADGRLDSSLDPKGYVRVLGGFWQFRASANAIAIQPDGRVLLGGGVNAVGAQSLAVVRFVEPSTPVPTLSSVGLAAMAVLLAAASLVTLRESRLIH